MIIENLEHKDKNSIYIYSSKRNFMIYSFNKDDNRFYEYYSSDGKIATGWSLPNDIIVPASTWKHETHHSYIKPITKIKLNRAGNPKVYIYHDDDGYYFINIDKTINENITNIRRIDNTVDIKGTTFGTFKVSNSVNPNDPALMELNGQNVKYILPDDYISEKSFVHYFVDDVYITSRQVNNTSGNIIKPPDAPHLKLKNKNVEVSWTSPYAYDWYTLVRRKNLIGSPWNVVGILIESPPIIDCGIDTNLSGSYFYRVIGIYNNINFKVGNESYISIPNAELLSLKPHGRATTNYKLTRTWEAPVVISCS